jgi:serine/threonine protein kinase
MTGLLGQTIGPYQVQEAIGQSGMAVIYRAVQPSLGREVVIKVLPSQFLSDSTFLERFNREVQVIARLQHPHIVPIHDYGEQDGAPYMVMSFYPGGTLAAAIEAAAGGLPLGLVARILRQIAQALDYAHAEGVIHRNIRPASILLDRTLNAYLADFSIAKVEEATANLTGVKVLGTPAYMAPELASSGALSPSVDIYALGITLFEALTGRLPFDAAHQIGLLLAHANQPVPDIRALRPDLPPGIQPVIERVLAKGPADRYPTALALAEALDAVAREAGSMAAHSPGTSQEADTDELAVRTDIIPADRLGIVALMDTEPEDVDLAARIRAAESPPSPVLPDVLPNVPRLPRHGYLVDDSDTETPPLGLPRSASPRDEHRSPPTPPPDELAPVPRDQVKVAPTPPPPAEPVQPAPAQAPPVTAPPAPVAAPAPAPARSAPANLPGGKQAARRARPGIDWVKVAVTAILVGFVLVITAAVIYFAVFANLTGS